MLIQFIHDEFKYDGSQLKPLFSYMNYGLLGDSAVAWIGPCHIPFSEMVDGEDLRQRATIAGDLMLHFIVEVFDRELASGVLIQRLFASIVKDLIHEQSNAAESELLARDGDDIYLSDKKLSISIASKSAISTQVHFAVNVTNKGTPVKTCSLEDLNIDPIEFAHDALQALQMEWVSVLEATRKVRPLG